MLLEPKTLLNNWVQALPPKEYTRLSPSSLGGCPRVHYWKLTNVAPTTPPSPAALLNFQIGFLWEELYGKALTWSGAEHEVQKYFEDPETNLGGTVDFLVKVGPDEWEIWDSKTQGSKWFWYTQKQIDAGTYDEFKEEYGYIIQQAVYIYLARKNGYNVTRAILSYASKDDGVVGKTTVVHLTPKIQADMLNRAAYLNECLKNRTLPQCECEGWKVGYCNYGNPLTREKNRTGKMVNTSCCPHEAELKEWATFVTQ